MAVVAALAIAVYANGISNGFVADDNWQLLRNPMVTSPANLPRMLGSGVWSFLGAASNYYRPLPFFIYSLLYACFGFHAAVFHSFMVLLHAGNAALVYLCVRRLSTTRIALFAGLLFAAHPIHSEVVDWIAALPDLMLTTLVLIGLWLLIRQEGAPGTWQIVTHCGLYLLAMLTKEPGVMLLPLYAGFGFFCLGLRWHELRRNAALYTGMAATLGIYFAMRQTALGSVAPARQMLFHFTPASFAMSVIVMAAQDLGRLVLPVNLNYIHMFHPTEAFTPELAISVVVLAAVAVAFWRARNALVSYGIFWMAATLALTLNLAAVNQSENLFAERYLYLPSVAFCWIAAWAWTWWAERQPRGAKIAAAAVLIACGAQTMARNGDWRDDWTLFQKTARQSPTSGFVHDELALLYVNRDAFDTALEHERLAVQYNPAMPTYRRKLGYLLLEKDPRGAAAEFQKLLDGEPGAAQSHCDLALAFERLGELQQAAAEYEQALRFEPRLREAEEGYRRVMAKLR